MSRGVVAWMVALVFLAWPGLSSAQGPLTLVAPAPGARVTAGAVTFEWQAVAGATSYRLTLCLSSGCGGTGQIANITTAATTQQASLAGGSYLYSVTAYQNTTLLAQSEVRLFWADDFCGGPFLTGDFNGDGRTDRLCSADGVTRVSLSTAEGFEAPQTWLPQAFVHPLAGDFNGDGLADVADFINEVWGDFYVALSNGQAFQPLSHWGAVIASEAGAESHCRYIYAVAGTGDFNGDGKTDVTCKIENGPNGSDEKLYVGISTGSTFSYQIAGHALCNDYEQGGTLDFDGDGRSDWYCIGKYNDLALVYPYVNGGLRAAVYVGDFCETQSYVLGDFNGDGRTD
ncbi:MAG TPA: VCBS repeat-containing protein, partial [Dermatophilaceae bacterium]|nr:VCBS repeat-containing protein [Dermatophilaceae bacterium]